jgi:hypothetical protein
VLSGPRRDTAPLARYFTDARSRHVQLDCNPVDCQAERFHEILTADFTRMNRRHQPFRLAHIYLFFPLVIVDDFHIVAMALMQYETDSPLSIDSGESAKSAIIATEIPRVWTSRGNLPETTLLLSRA